MKITTKNFDALLRGASLLACGGGLSFPEQARLARQARMQSGLEREVNLKPLEELENTDVVITVSEVGAADAPVMDKSRLSQALDKLESELGQTVTALVPGEIGQEMIVLETAMILGLPVVDTDLSGARAVPRLSDIVLLQKGVPFTLSPAVVMLPDGQLEFIAKQADLLADEKVIRAQVPRGQVVTLLGGSISGQKVKQHLKHQSYSLALGIGNELNQGKVPNMVKQQAIFGPAEVTVQKVIEKESAGFSVKTAELQIQGQRAQLAIENEFMQLQVGAEQFSFPDLIMLFELEKKRGLHSSELRAGQKIQVAVVPSLIK